MKHLQCASRTHENRPGCRLAYTLPGTPAAIVVAAAHGCLQLVLLLVALSLSLLRAGVDTEPEEDTTMAVVAEREGGPGQHEAAALEFEPCEQLVPAGPGSAQLLEEEEERREPLLLRSRASPHLQPRQQSASAGRAAWLPGRQPGPPLLVAAEEGAPEVSIQSRSCWRGRRAGRSSRLPLGLPPAVVAALEIGGYNTTGTLCQTAGLAVSRRAGRTGGRGGGGASRWGCLPACRRLVACGRRETCPP